MADTKKMTEEDLCIAVRSYVESCEKYSTERSVDREKAMEYFDGKMNDTPSEDGRSAVVSRDVRAACKKALPSIVRTIIGGDKIVEYVPAAEGDEGTAEQATDYVNTVVLPESGGRQAIEDAINDAVRLRNGILKWWQEERKDVRVSMHSGLDEMAFTQLVADDDVEVLAHTERKEQVQDPQTNMPVETIVHDVRIKRIIKQSRTKVAAIAPENFLIHPDAIRLDDSLIVGESTAVTRSDLVAMGYERERVWKLPIAASLTNSQDNEELTRRRDEALRRYNDGQTKATEEVKYYELLVRIDFDNDGIAELRRLIFAGDITEDYLLENDHWDEIYYADVVCERRPHQWEGNSIPDEMMDIQRINTVLLRETLDNLYWQNNLQPAVQAGQVLNPESVTNPKFGQPIMMKAGTDVRTAIQWNIVPMVADKSFAMIEYIKKEGQDRTGISDASAGLPPDALQNVTAKATAMLEQTGIGQTELIVRTIADSLKPVFRGLLKLVIQHQDKPRTIRLRNEWVQFDPRSWNADMDASVNTGLGAGTRERDMMAMGQVVGLQKELLTAFGAGDNPFVSPDNLYNAISKMTEAAGLKSVDLYFTKPDPEKIKAALAAKAQQPPPEVQKIMAKGQVDMQLEDKRGQVKKEVAAFQGQQKAGEFRTKLVADANKEREQRDADMATNAANAAREQQNQADKNAADMVKNEQNAQIKLIDIASRERIARMHAASRSQGEDGEGPTIDMEEFSVAPEPEPDRTAQLLDILRRPRVIRKTFDGYRIDVGE